MSALHVWITVSSLANKDPNNAKALLFRQIELNWINAPLEDENDYIGLYLDSQPDDNSLPVSVHRLNGQSSGQIITDYYLPQIDFYNETKVFSTAQKLPPNEESRSDDSIGRRRSANMNEDQYLTSPLWRGAIGFASGDNRQQAVPAQRLLSDECIGYCLAYHSRNKIMARNCLKTNPNWMLDTYQYIGSRSLPTLMIPGTHNSATYQVGQLDGSVLQMINKYQMNQDENIFSQLVYGIRYFDLRVGYSKLKQRKETYWVYHDIFRTDVPINDVFEQIKRFLDLTSHEIIIMDFHRFTVGFQNENLTVQRERHAKLIDLMYKHLGQYIVPSYLGQHAPLNEYISAGKRLIVGYANKADLVGSQAENQLFGMFKDRGRQQVRDSDAAKQEELNVPLEPVNQNHHEPRGNGHESQTNNTDGRIGSRMLNKLKSIKILTSSFSKRWTSGDSMRHNSRLISQEEDNNSAGQEDAASTSSSLMKVALFFSPVRHLWPNKDTIDGLSQYMNETTCRKYFGELRSMMVELTPTVFGAIADKYDGNRKLAQQVNRQVTDWIRDRWLHCINIVASDFFLGNDLIRLSIYANKMRVLHRNVDLNSYGHCKSFRRVEHLLDKSKIPIQFAYEYSNYPSLVSDFSPDNIGRDIIRHISSDGNQILLKPLAPSLSSRSMAREKRDSFVDNVSDGFSNLVSSFKRLLNL